MIWGRLEMTIRFMATLGVAAALAGMAAAQGALGIFDEVEAPEAFDIRPGLYDVEITQTQSGYANGERIERPPQTQKGQMCLQPEGELVKPAHFTQPGCNVVVRSADIAAVYFTMNCKRGDQDMSGYWKMGKGQRMILSTDSYYFRLPDGRSAIQQFYVSGSLHSQEDQVQASLSIEQQFEYAGECPG